LAKALRDSRPAIFPRISKNCEQRKARNSCEKISHLLQPKFALADEEALREAISERLSASKYYGICAATGRQLFSVQFQPHFSSHLSQRPRAA
jgi:hypothetical protein